MGRKTAPKYIDSVNTKWLEFKLAWVFRKHFRLHNQVYKMAIKFVENKDLNWNEYDAFSKVSTIILSTSLHRFKSIYYLCKKGHARDTLPLLRTAFENLVDLKYMQIHKEKISDYFDYMSYLKLKLIKQRDKSVFDEKELEVINNTQRELESKWEQSKSKFTYFDSNGKERICDRWTCKKRLKDLATEVGLADIYDHVWSYYSHFSHGSVLAANNFFLGFINESARFEIGSSPEFVEEAIYNSCANFIDIISVINENYNLGFNDHLEKMSLKFKELMV